MLNWFVANTHARSEEKAKANLERQGFEVYLPRYLKKRSHARRIDFVPTALFSRYLFVGMDMEQARWRAINSTIGVSNLVANGTAPLSVPQQIIQGIRSREDTDGWVTMIQPIPYKKGEKVQIKSGPLTDQVGLFDCVDDSERIFILLDLLGRPVKIRVDAEQIGALA